MATLTISFTAPTPAPADGYVVKYRPVGGSGYTTVTPNPTASPVVITGVTDNTSYEGTVQSDCGGVSSAEESFLITVNPVVPCGSGASYSGGESFPFEQVITLGSGTGTVTLDYNAFSVPDRFVVIYDGMMVIDTGYRGESSEQASLDAALITKGAPAATIEGVGLGSASFIKSTSTTVAVLRVYAPISSTAWDATLSCPV